MRKAFVLIAMMALPAFAQQKMPAPYLIGSTDYLPVKLSSGTMAEYLISRLTPIYPPVTKGDHASGPAVLRAIISKQGNVTRLDVISGPPLLAWDFGCSEEMEVQAVSSVWGAR